MISGKTIGQIYFVNNYSVESGLPTSFIYDVTQDNKGRMWFATAAGISIYDGFLWKNMNLSDSLPNTVYRKIITDEKGIVWAIPQYMCETLVYFVNDSIRKVNLPEARNNHHDYAVNSLNIYYEDNNPVVYAGTFNGVYIYKDGKWLNLTVNDGLINNLVFSITKYNEKYYIATSEGVSVLKNGKINNSLNDFFKDKYNIVLKFELEKFGNKNSKLWALGKGWLGCIENNKLQIVKDNIDLPSGTEYEFPSLCLAKNNLIYLGNYYYTFCYNRISGALLPLTHKEGFKSDGSTSIFTDREDNVWKVGTRGVDKLNNLYLVNFGTENGLLENEVSAIFEYKPGKLLLGHNYGITFFSREKTVKIDFPKNINKYPGDLRILDVCATKDGTIWLAGSNGGVGKTNESGIIKWYKVSEKNYISSVAVDKKDVVWVTSSDGVFCKKGDKFVEPTNFNVKKQFYRRIFFFDDEMFFTSSSVLVWIKGDKVNYYAIEGKNNANNVFSVFKNTDSEVFVGTKDGLYVIRNNVYEKYNINGFKVDNPIYSILKDKSGNYWFGTDDGVVKWDGKNKSQTFVKANGLSGLEINRAAFCNDSYGNIWIGTESGLSCYRPEYDNNKIPVPEILLLNAEDPLGEKHSLLNEFKIKSDIKSLYFSFRGVSYYNEPFIKYKIKLEGFDADWYEISQQHIDNIRYTNLIPGEYKFHVAAKNISGEWSNVYSSALITIEKPYYKKWWFIVIFLSVLAFFLYLIYRLYLTRVYYINLEKKVQIRTAKLRDTEKELRNTQAFLEEKVKERTNKLGIVNEQLKELNASKDKFFSIIAHDLKSPFVGLLGYSELLKNEIDELPKEKIIEYSENLHKNIKNTYNLLENLLNWALLQTKRMSFNEQRLDLYLEIKSILEMFDANSRTKNIILVNNVNIETTIDVDKNMFRTILYNLISNAIKYTNPGGQVKVHTKMDNGNIEIYVSDDGVGMDKVILDKLFNLNSNISTKGTAQEKGTGLGLILIKEMVDMHNGKILAESEPGKGTTFCVVLPRKKE
jgi:signal transduction histidine kinase/ligand-binding sensor domain-containing protein